MEPSGGTDHHRRRPVEREALLHNGGAPILFGGASLAHYHLSDHGGGPDSSNPDPVSFAFAGPPAVTSPGSRQPKLMQPQPQPQPPSAVRYKECLRNHAASVGGSVFDGCGEFMPAGEEGTLDSLKCAACNCHRNFHRKETASGGGGEGSSRQYGGYQRSLAPLQLPAPPALPSPSMIHHHHGGGHHHPRPYSSLSIVPPMSVAYGGPATGNESSSEDLNLFGSSPGGGYLGTSNSGSGKKRFRTKFTPEQRDKMIEFAEKIGWRIQRQSDEDVERFCAETGVKRQVFKVWMHNNKNNVNKSSPSSSSKPNQPDNNHDDDHGQEPIL